ncbi:MAG: DnaJ domain-containing protein [Pseudomonadota bacterium]
MFERNTIDNGNDLTAIAAEVTTDTEEVWAGRFILSRGRDLHATLNGPDLFILFERYGGKREYLAKSSIKAIRALETGAIPRLHTAVRDDDNFDPHQILGLRASATLSDVRSAWHSLSMAYHPDRYANAELPTEVTRYLEAMARRINAAYEALEATADKRRREKLRAQHAAPIYESRPRS